MNVKTLFKTACCTIIALLLLNGCNNDFDNGLVTSVNLRDKFNQTTDTFNPGEDETINMTLSVKNDSTSEKTLSFPSENQYDFVIKDEADTEIWRWSEHPDLEFEPITTTFSLGPTDIQTVTYTWDQNITIQTIEIVDGVETTTTETNPISSGNYTLEAYFIGYGPVAKTALTIQ